MGFVGKKKSAKQAGQDHFISKNWKAVKNFPSTEWHTLKDMNKIVYSGSKRINFNSSIPTIL